MPGRLTEKDRLRYIILFVESEEIVEAFKRSQHAMEGGPEGSLSRRGCDDRLPGWEELLVERFNDAEVQARTTVKPHLHAEFAVAINCPKGEYQLTVDKAKDFLQDQKHKIRPIVNNYNASGNGSDMMVMEDIDSDSEELHNFNDDEDEGDDRRRPRTECCEANWGRFKAERAQKRAQRLLERVDSDDIERRTHLQELVMMNGDDRRSFLRGQPTSLLYIWDELDKHQLLFKVAAMLDGNTGSSSTKTPAPINRRGARGTKRSGKNKTQPEDAKMLKTQAEMSRHVKDTVREMRIMNENMWREQLEKLRKETFQLKLQSRKARIDGETDLVDMIADELKTIETQVRKLESKLEGDDAHQRLAFAASDEDEHV